MNYAEALDVNLVTVGPFDVVNEPNGMAVTAKRVFEVERKRLFVYNCELILDQISNDKTGVALTSRFLATAPQDTTFVVSAPSW